MIKLDAAFLADVGLALLPEQLRPAMLNHIYETLELRVGMQIAVTMDDDELTEFESYLERNDEAGGLRFLETHRPDYKQVVEDNLDRLRADIREVAPQILRDEGIDPDVSAPTTTAPS